MNNKDLIDELIERVSKMSDQEIDEIFEHVKAKWESEYPDGDYYAWLDEQFDGSN